MLSTAYYFLQVIFCSAVMMGYYWLVLRDKKFHQYNRFYLLSVLLLSWIIPVIKIQWTKPVDSNAQVINFLSIVADSNAEIDANLAKNSSQWSWEVFAVTFYFVVAAIMLGILIIGLVRLYVLLKKHSCKNLGDVYLILTQVKGTPFSFFRYIFWHEAIDLRSDAGKKMLEHELTHVQQKHSIDKVLIQVVLIVGWFNPLFWLLKKEMEMIHEFIADNKSVQDGDSASLAQLLLTAAYPQQQFLLTTPFFFSPIKRRIAMITNNKNPRFSYLRRLVILPILAIVVVLVAFRKKDAELSLFPSTQLNKTYTIVIDAGHGGKDHGALSKDQSISESEIVLSLAKEIRAVNTNPNIKIVLSRESDVFNTVEEKADFTNIQKADYLVSLHANASNTKENNSGIEFVIPQKDQSKRYVRSGQLAMNMYQAMKGLTENFHDIKSSEKGVWILKSTNCPAVLIEVGYMTNSEDLQKLLNKDYQRKLALSILQGINSFLAGSEHYSYKTIIDTAKIIINDTTKEPLVIVDGKIQPNGAIKKLNPNSIEKMEVLKNESATIVYGEAGKNGVILITTKAPMKIKLNGPITPIGKNTIYYLDGVKIDSSVFRKLNQDKIATVEVWKGEEAIKKFGMEGENGVIIIKSKKDVKDIKLEKVQLSSNKDGELKTIQLIDPKAIYYINGIKSDSATMHHLDPKSIEIINVWKGTDALERFGKEATNGVIDVKLKQPIKN